MVINQSRNAFKIMMKTSNENGEKKLMIYQLNHDHRKIMDIYGGIKRGSGLVCHVYPGFQGLSAFLLIYKTSCVPWKQGYT